ncbi:MAG: ribosomal protein S18-alanine N-acetyltransferase [Chloroflexota bacterium]
MSLMLRYMRLADIPAVAAIDQMSFTPPWSAKSYQFEVTESTYSHMVVLEYGEEKPKAGWRRLVPGLNGAHHEGQQVVGYGGLWNIMDEAHISTIATHPQQRGRGWGEIVLAGMIRRAIRLEALQVVLEVRVSNHTAQNLYQKYGFKTAATKPNYYHSNNEDAYEMHLNLDQRYYCAHFEERFAKLVAQHELIDQFTEADAPRHQRDS